jgi:Spy/CpxP family protein refolding chaperone
MTKRLIVAAGLIAALAGASGIAVADQPQPGVQGPGRPGPRGGPRGGPLMDFGLRGVQLTDTQRDQARSILESHKAEFADLAAKLRTAHAAFAQAVRSGPVDEAAIRERSTAVASAMADEAILRAKVRTEVEALLTPEQQEQLKQRRAEMEKRMSDGLKRPRQAPRKRGAQP